MHNIIKSPELFPKEEYEALGPEEKEKYVSFKIKELLELNKERGVTINQIVEALQFHRNTVSKHLDKLLAKQEAYRYPPNNRNSLYYPNGSISRPVLEENRQIGNKFYNFVYLKNPFGDFLYVQEKSKDAYGAFASNGGIILPLDAQETFLMHLKEAFEQAKKLERDNK